MSVALRTRDLGKRFGDVTAVTGVELSVSAGEVYGFLGRNGAGKTTTIRLLLGMLRPSAGHAEVFGRRVGPGAEVPWERVGHLVEAATAYPDLTVRENLEVARRLQGVADRGVVERRLGDLGLADLAGRRARTLSTGNLQRLALARALLHDPDLVLLDEPTVGLDPAGVVEVRELLRSLARDRGAAVFLSSHNLDEVERVADRVGIVHRGSLVAELDAGELGRRRRCRLEIAARDPVAAQAALRAAGYRPERRGDLLELRDGAALERPDEVARDLVAAGTPPTRLALAQDDLEDLFLSLTAPEGGGP